MKDKICPSLIFRRIVFTVIVHPVVTITEVYNNELFYILI